MTLAHSEIIEAMRAMGGSGSLKEIAGKSGYGIGTVRYALADLCAAGTVTRTGRSQHVLNGVYVKPTIKVDNLSLVVGALGRVHGGLKELRAQAGVNGAARDQIGLRTLRKLADAAGYDIVLVPRAAA